MKNTINDDVIHMLKNGMDPAGIQALAAENQRKSYNPVFSDFMQDMLQKYKVKRTEIARRTGISQDYLYKVLNGSKKTSEKDYVVAICIAVGMNLPETQHALAANGMPLLNSKDLREYILISCITEKRGVLKTNDWLESTGFPLLRVSRDMEQYIPRITYDEQGDMDETDLGFPEEFDEEYWDDEKDPDRVIKPSSYIGNGKRFREVNREVTAEQCGNAPFDYTYIANIDVEDENGNLFHVQGYFSPEGTLYSVLDDENHKKFLQNVENGDFDNVDWETLEEFADLDDAYTSEFFKYYLEADKATDDKAREIYEMLCDTKNYGQRFGFGVYGGKTCWFGELYDAAVPEERRYFQVIESDDEITYSASHESVYMYIETGDFYPVVFGEREEPQYFIKAHSEKELADIDTRSRFILQALKTSLDAWAKETFGDMIPLDNSQIIRQEMNSTAQMATVANNNGDYEGSLELNKKLLEMAENLEKDSGEDVTATIIVTTWKIYNCYSNLGDEENEEIWRKKILDCRDRMYKAIERGDGNLNGAVHCYAEVLINSAGMEKSETRHQAIKNSSKEAIDLLEGRCEDISEWGLLFAAYTNYAYELDEENRSEEAVDYYEKAYEILRRNHLENSRFLPNALTFYNNYAWVLWNRMQNEEAIIYYGRAIELAEDSMDSPFLPREATRNMLQHYAEALNSLYKDTGKTREAKRLKERMKKNNIKI